MKQQIISKYGKKFTALHKGATPILQGVHYAIDGSVLVTDRHQALRIKNAHSFKESMTLHAKTGQPIEGEYPNLAKIMDGSSNCKAAIVIPGSIIEEVANRIRCVADTAVRLNKAVPIVAMEFKNGNVWVTAADESVCVQTKAFLGVVNFPSLDLKITLNGVCLHTALSVFADAGVKKLEIRFNGAMNPISFTDNGDIDVVVLPYRTNS